MADTQIIDDLYRHRDEIIDKLRTQNWKHFRDYFFITAEYLKNNLDEYFQRIFCRFYALNGPGGLTKLQKDIFFQLLSLRETDLSKIIKKLYAIPGYHDSHRLFLSFGTKLLHTIDTNLPIYDGNIAYILGLQKQESSKFLDRRISNRMDIYDELKSRFISLSSNAKIKKYMLDIRQKLGKVALADNFNWQNNMLSDIKLLDSAIWALYSIIKH